MNPEVMQELREAAKIQPGTKESFPTELSRVIIPTLEVNPRLTKTAIAKFAAAAGSTSSTLYTTPTNQDFYLCTAQLSLIKDVTATSNQSKIVIVQNGLSVTVCAISSITLTAQADSISVTFPHPLKCDRNTTITVQNSAATATIRADGQITGYLDEQSLA